MSRRASGAPAAAKDLRKYIKKMTGTEPKIVRESKKTDDVKHIYVGKTLRSEELGIEKPTGYPGVERVIVDQREGDLFVLGNDDGNYNGTQFAVNMLLEHLGCGWFGEGELWEVVPELKDIDLTGLKIDHSPRFNSRITRVYSGDWQVADKWYLGGNKSLTGHWLFQIAPASMYSKHPEWYALTKKARATRRGWIISSSAIPTTSSPNTWRRSWTNISLRIPT